MQNRTFQSLCVSEPKDNKTTQPHRLPLYATSSFVMENTEDAISIFKGQKKGHVYSRYANPTIDAVAQKIADLEGFGQDIRTYGYLTSSGMSAISTLMMALVNSGDSILTQGNLYGGTTELFIKAFGPKGIKTLFHNFDDIEGVIKILKIDTSVKVIYLESPANPTLSCIDLKLISSIAREHRVLTVIDNTFCTPYLQRPLDFGIDFVVHSTTKFLNGMGNSISGVIVGQREDYKDRIWQTLKLMGGTCNSWDAWLINNGLKTLTFRMDKHSENALFLAQNLENHPEILKVNYNGLSSHPYHSIAKKQMSDFGGMISFEVNRDLRGTIEFIDQLKLATHAPTLGDTDTLVLHPVTSSHLNVDKALCREYGISENLVRFSVGLEHKQDILDDVLQALES